MSDAKTNRITIKVTHTKLMYPSKPSVEKSLAIERPQFDKIRSKSDLLKHLAGPLKLNVEDVNQLKLFRKSKKQKDYVALESTDDFKALARSLKVKNHIKLVINDTTAPVPESTESSSKKRKIQTMDFSSLGDALLEAAFEHFKDLFNDDSSTNATASNSNSASTSTTTTTSTTDAKASEPSSEKDAKTKNHLDEIVHTNIACDSCSPDTFVPIKGTRYACLVCPNFDLCESCEANQHSNQTNIGSHSYKHPMAKISYLDSEFDRKRFGRRCFGQTQGQSHGHHGHGHHGRHGHSVYDIPVEISSTTAKSLFANGGFEKIVENANRYESLIKLLESTAHLEADALDDDIKFTLLKSVLEDNLAPVPPYSSGSPAASHSTVLVPKVDSIDKIVINTKKIGNNSRVISLMLTNNSKHTITGGDLKFEFYNLNHNEIVIVKNANSIKPGQTRFYNLGGLHEIFSRLSGMNLKITTSNGLLEGIYNENEDSLMTFSRIDDEDSNEDTQTDLTLNNEDEINVTLVPKSSSLAQIIIYNKSKKTVDCSDLKLEIVNCFGKSVVAVMVRKRHGIFPGKIGKFNIGLINAHMKFPFKLIMKNDFNTGYCELNIKNLSGNFNFDPLPVHNEADEPDLINLEQTPEVEDDVRMEDEEDAQTSGTESIVDEKDVGDVEIEVVEDDNEKDSSELEQSSSISGSTHSIILPSLPREAALSGSEYLDARENMAEGEEHQQSKADEEDEPVEDYDLISDGENDVGSDYEILSPVASNSV
ncbi:uncharacterized protein RJT21DRAFT_105568 [Scheffersomyces amazonensis]|uniref:uncharacterized protein n=1 Tax=Scheffersomyces amazonensis TaxID=1078765 RepID=UPI00315C8E4F